MNEIQNSFNNVQKRIQKALSDCHRSSDNVQLLAVSKTRTANEITQLFSLGQTAFGENYLQEALEKIKQLADKAIEWHFIGQIQSNKTRLIAENFSVVHSLYQFKQAQRLNNQRPSALPPLKVYIQVNIEKETTKAGVFIEDLNALALKIEQLPYLKLMGLMAIPAPTDDFERQKKQFQQLKKCLGYTQVKGLSMGMSNDLEAAICEGSTIVRVGTALFGKRV